MPQARWRYLGFVPYTAAIAIQARVAADRAADRRPDTLLLLQHPPTITLGRRASDADVCWTANELERRGIATMRVGRGGGVTYHGPGQLVGYPIVRLAHQGRSVRRFVEDLEKMLIDVAVSFGIPAQKQAGHPGIWTGDAKLASIGIEVHRSVSRHGFAINTDMDLAPFSGIVPCGVPDMALTDLTRAAGSTVTIAAVAAAVVQAWRRRFGEIKEEEADEL